MTIKVGGTAAGVATPDSNGNVAGSFTVQAGLLLGPQTVTMTQGVSSPVTSPTSFVVTSGTPSAANPVDSGYAVGVTSIKYWSTTSLAFGSSCTTDASGNDGGLQLITVAATAPNGIGQNLSFVVRNPGYAP